MWIAYIGIGVFIGWVVFERPQWSRDLLDMAWEGVKRLAYKGWDKVRGR